MKACGTKCSTFPQKSRKQVILMKDYYTITVCIIIPDRWERTSSRDSEVESPKHFLHSQFIFIIDFY